jgi:hypothetical protein
MWTSTSLLTIAAAVRRSGPAWALLLLALCLTGCRLRAFGLETEWRHGRTVDTVYFAQGDEDGAPTAKLTAALTRRPAPSLFFGASLLVGDERVNIYREYHRLREPRVAQPYDAYHLAP